MNIKIWFFLLLKKKNENIGKSFFKCTVNVITNDNRVHNNCPRLDTCEMEFAFLGSKKKHTKNMSTSNTYNTIFGSVDKFIYATYTMTISFRTEFK